MRTLVRLAVLTAATLVPGLTAAQSIHPKVWTRSGASSLTRGSIDFSDDAGALFRGPSENTFLVKLNYWLGL